MRYVCVVLLVFTMMWALDSQLESYRDGGAVMTVAFGGRAAQVCLYGDCR